jgi:hypothetical protein
LFFFFKDVFADVYANGTILVTPPALITTACKVNVINFPFDEKNCLMQFGRFANKIKKLELTTTVGPCNHLNCVITWKFELWWCCYKTWFKALKPEFSADNCKIIHRINKFWYIMETFYFLINESWSYTSDKIYLKTRPYVMNDSYISNLKIEFILMLIFSKLVY